MTEPQYKEKIGTHVQLPVQYKVDEYIVFLEENMSISKEYFENYDKMGKHCSACGYEGMNIAFSYAIEKAKELLK